MVHKSPVTGLGDRIRTAREAAGMTQTELGVAAGLARPQNAISEIERGIYQPAFSRLVAVAQALESNLGDETVTPLSIFGNFAD